jgi:hypothetical protein
MCKLRSCEESDRRSCASFDHSEKLCRSPLGWSDAGHRLGSCPNSARCPKYSKPTHSIVPIHCTGFVRCGQLPFIRTYGHADGWRRLDPEFESWQVVWICRPRIAGNAWWTAGKQCAWRTRSCRQVYASSCDPTGVVRSCDQSPVLTGNHSVGLSGSAYKGFSERRHFFQIASGFLVGQMLPQSVIDGRWLEAVDLVNGRGAIT